MPLRRAGTATHPQLIRRVCALQIAPSAPRILPIRMLQLPSHRTLLEVVEGLAGAPGVVHPGQGRRAREDVESGEEGGVENHDGNEKIADARVPSAEILVH